MLQILIYGLINGLIISIFALGFQFVYLPVRVLHIAGAGIYMLVPYVAKSLFDVGWGWGAILVALFSAVVLSVLCEVLNHRPLTRKHATHGAHMIASLGTAIVIMQIISMVWKDEVQAYTGISGHIHHHGSITFSTPQLTALAGGIITLLAVWVVLQYSKVGTGFRAMADNPVEFMLAGHNLNTYRLLAFCGSGLLIGAASLFSSFDVGFDTSSGLHALLLALAAVIVGGRNSFTGPVIGGLVIGVARSVSSWWLSAAWQDVVVFVLLCIILFIRPSGICASRTRLETSA